jgi:hypothetical protein
VILENIFVVFFELVMQRNGQKRDKKNRRDKRQDFFPSFFWQKVFGMDFPQKVFGGVFELLWLRNAQKHHKKYASD